MLYRPRHLGGNLRRVKHSGRCGTFFITTIVCLHTFHALEKSCKCPNCPVAGVSSRRKCWIVTCLTTVLAGIKTTATGDRNRGRRRSSNSPFHMLQHNSSLFSKPKAVLNISVNCLHSPHSSITQFCWWSPLPHSEVNGFFEHTLKIHHAHTNSHSFHTCIQQMTCKSME